MMKEMLVNNVALQIMEWNGERVITLKDIDRVHGRVEGTAKNRYTSNKKRFVEGKDFYKISKREFNNLFGTSNVLKGNPNLPIMLVTKSGYLMITKVMDDDKSWEVQRQLVNAYFVLEKIVEQKKAEMETPVVSVPSVVTDKANNEVMLLINEQKQLFELEVKNNEIFRLGLLDSFQKMSSIVMEQSKTIDRQAEMINRLLETISNKSVREIAETNVDVVEVIEPIAEPIVEVIEEIVEPKVKKITRKNKETNSGEYHKWKHMIENLLIGYDKAEIYKRTFKYMQKHYGICWEQERKDFKNNKGYKASSTLEVIYFLEKDNFVLRRLFEGSIDSVCKLNQRTRCIEIYPVTSVKEMETLVAYIAKETNNNSPHNSSMWRGFFNTVYKNHEYCKNELQTHEKTYRYEHEIGSGNRVSKLDILKEYPNLEKFYVKQFNEWVREVYPEIVSQLTK